MKAEEIKRLISRILACLLIIFGLGVLAVAINYTFFGPYIPKILRLVFFFLLIADAVCYFLAAWGVAREIKRIYLPAIALLIVNIFGLVFDDFGLVDALAALINIIILILLFLNYKKLN